jgi:hypothetical protein
MKRETNHGRCFRQDPQRAGRNRHEGRGLSPRVRRVLIFVDGKRSVDDMRAMLQSDDLQHTLGMLEEEGYVELSGVIDAASTLKPPPGPLASITAFTDLPSTPTRSACSKRATS